MNRAVVDDALGVHRTFLVSGDVDRTTGNMNIAFDGPVQVLGSVRDGCWVRAIRDIEIHGQVEAGEVTSAEGAVRVLGGIAGRGRCFISAGTDVEAKYIESARVYARRNVVVDVAIVNSEVTAGGSVSAPCGRGAIVGGVVRAGHSIDARSLGAPNGPVTDVSVGIGIERCERIRAADQRLASLRNAARGLEEAGGEFEPGDRDFRKMSGSEKDLHLKLRKQLLTLHYEIDRLEIQRRDLVGGLRAEVRGTVRASCEVLGNVIVRIGSLVDRVEEPLGATAFGADPEAGRIVRGH
jgi:uncharacterized protein (DUF342 family)